MKRFVTVLLCVFVINLTIVADEQRESADVVIMLDTSGTILPYFEDINNRIINQISDSFLRIGDTVHVLSFNAETRYEMSQKIYTEADLSRLVSRFMLLYPIGKNSDFLTALDFSKSYISDLTVDSKKIMIIISDGIFNPAQRSLYVNYTAEQIKSKIAASAQNIRQAGWDVFYIKLPYPENAVVRGLDGELYSQKKSESHIAQQREQVSNKETHAEPFLEGASSADDAIVSQNNYDGVLAQGSDASTIDTIQTNNTDTSATTEDQSEFIGATNTTSSNQIDATESMGATHTSSDNQESAEDTTENNLTYENSDNPTVAEIQGSETMQDTEILASDEPSAVSDVTTPATEKQYTDVSSEFTKSVGIENSELPTDPDAAINFSQLQVALPIVRMPSSLSSSSYAVVLPISIKNVSDEELSLRLQAIVLDDNGTALRFDQNMPLTVLAAGQEANIEGFFDLPHELQAGTHTITLRLDFADDLHVEGAVAQIRVAFTPSAVTVLFGDNGLMYIIVMIIVILLMFLLLLMLLRKRTGAPAARTLRSSSSDAETVDRNRVKEQKHSGVLDDFANGKTQSSQARQSQQYTRQRSAVNVDSIIKQKVVDTGDRMAVLNSANIPRERGKKFRPASRFGRIEVKKNTSGMTELFVDFQNKAIGKRNIHVMKPGTRLSLGGSSSDAFFIFLVPFPAKLAQVRYDGEDCHLAILRPEYFPYESENVIRNCSNQVITVVSDKGYHVDFCFRQYEDPAEKLNAILQSISYQ